MRRILGASLALVLVAGSAIGAQQGPGTAAARVPGSTAKEAIDAAATALGGSDRILKLRNITLIGYAQYAYQNGGGNITALPGAPQKFIAANDYRRVYDLEHGRMRHLERRNDLFPFANYGGHDFALQNQVLDGSVAYNVTAKGAVRGGDARDRRMWMHTNPIVALRAALNGSAMASNRRQEGDLTLVDLRLKEGDMLTIAIRPPSNTPAWIRWSGPNANLGEVIYTTHFYGYVPFQGVSLPMGYTTKLDWRDVDFLKLYVDGYLVDTAIEDIAAPATLAAAPAGRGGGAGGGPGGVNVQVTPVARGLWRITGGTMVIEFADHMTLFEVGGGAERVAAVIKAARQIVPSKPVTEVIVSHHHFDHTAGLRQAVAEGLRVISRRDNGVIFREMTSRPTPNFPDALGRNPKPLEFIPVDDHLQLKDATMTVDIYHVIANNHMADAVFAYIPEHKAMIEGDIATAAEDLQWWGDSWLDNINYRKLDVQLNVPVHMDVMTREQVLKMVAPGIQRVKEFCAQHLARGNYFQGCPAQVR
ncbi:MAG TPA: MBL fold metallo-hydrolase [Vicinamibacterales bacterium]|nr:MBL fold metallo-hydrolase [Vicinamibacterales bacterium]